MITWIYEFILKVCRYADDHRTAFDFSVGGGIGLLSGLAKYWKHFTDPEVQFHYWDGILGGLSTTVVCAIALHLIHKILKPKKKDDSSK